MAKLRNFLTRFQVQYLPSTRLAKIVMVTAAAVCAVTTLTVHLTYQHARQKLEGLQELAAQLELENQDLTNRIEGLGTAESIRQIAQEELGMVDAGVIIIEED